MHREPPASELDPEIAFAGWDPYIVAITGGVVCEPAHSAADGAERNAAATESRSCA